MLTIHESAGGYMRAFLTGLGGAATGGNISSYYDTQKEQAALNAAALSRRDPLEMYNANTAGKGMLYTLGGTIPVVGSITNMMAYSDRMDAEKAAKLLGSFGTARKRMYSE